MRTRYICSAEEWVFSKMHSVVIHPDRGYRSKMWLGCVWLACIPLLTVAITLLGLIAGVPEEQLEWMKERAQLISLALVATFFIRAVRIPAGERRKPVSGETTALLLTDHEGIWINLFNAEESKYTPMLEWSSITQVFVDITCDLNEYTKGRYNQKAKEETFAEWRRKLPGFEEEAFFMYSDRFTLLLNGRHSKNGKQAIVQIPKSWLRDGQFAALINDIRRNTGANLEFYRPQSATHFKAWKERSMYA